MGKIDERLAAAGVELPPPPGAMGAYVPAVVAGSLVFVSGQLPRWGDDFRPGGKLGAEISVEQGREAARLAGLNAVAVLKAELGDLDRVLKIVKLVGSVASAPGFVDQPAVVNGASDAMLEVFGERGRHARMAVGVAELPANACVAVEIIAAIEA